MSFFFFFLPFPAHRKMTNTRYSKLQLFSPPREEKYSRQLEELKLHPAVWVGSNFNLLWYSTLINSSNLSGMTILGLSFSYIFLGLHEHSNILLPLKKYTSKTSQLIKIVKDTLVLPIENSKLRQNCEDGNQKDGKKKTNTTKWLLVLVPYWFRYVVLFVRSQITCPNS